MLRELHISGLGVIEDLDLELAPGPQRADRRDGRGQDDGHGRSPAGARRARVGLARSEGRGRGASAGAVRRHRRGRRVGGGRRGRPRAVDRRGTGDRPRASGVSSRRPRRWRSSARGSWSSTGRARRSACSRRPCRPAFLDRFAGDAHLVALGAYRETHDRLRATRAELEELQAAARDRERELDLLAYQVREIEAVGAARRRDRGARGRGGRLAHVERLMEQSSRGRARPHGGGRARGRRGRRVGLETPRSSIRRPPRCPSGPGGSPPRSRELARDVRAYGEALLPDPERLEDVRERIAELKQLHRKYGATEPRSRRS